MNIKKVFYMIIATTAIMFSLTACGNDDYEETLKSGYDKYLNVEENEKSLRYENGLFTFDADEGEEIFNSISKQLIIDNLFENDYTLQESIEADDAYIYSVLKNGQNNSTALFFFKDGITGNINEIRISYADNIDGDDKANSIICMMMLADDRLDYSQAEKLGIKVMQDDDYCVVNNGLEYSFDGDHIWIIRIIE